MMLQTQPCGTGSLERTKIRKNLSETGIFIWCPLWSLWLTARYKHKEFLIQRLYLSRNLARSSHRSSLVLKTHSKERRGDPKSENNDSIWYIQVPCQIIKDLAIRL